VLAVIKPINKLVVQGREFADLAIIQ